MSETSKNNRHYLGIDLGSVSLNVVVIDEEAGILQSVYRRTEGRPLRALREAFTDLSGSFETFYGAVATGSGRKLVGGLLKIPDQNEIVTQAKATYYLHPGIRTIIEIGGQDSKLIFLQAQKNGTEPVISDHVLNEVCAAGTGSFLDLQAHRLGMPVEELGKLALRSQHPARISGRCSVFAKSDMVHLLQEGTPTYDIVAGLCRALVTNYIANLAKGKPFVPPVAFQGGVAANPGVVRSFEEQLELNPGELIIPENFMVMGAFGSALKAQNERAPSPRTLSELAERVTEGIRRGTGRGALNHYLTPLKRPGGARVALDRYYQARFPKAQAVFLGIDVGAVSTNLVLIDRDGCVVAKQYWYTKGELIQTVRKGLEEMGAKVGDRVTVCGVGVTGSGRYFVGDFIGADVVINEISAQAKAAMFCDPQVDTILEIGGQDAKYIRCRDGRVTHFEMNKVCAAGTGSFLEEQAARLKVPVREGFSELAFAAERPANLGARCTVFMESDLIHHQQTGKGIEDLTAGLAYAIAQNYREKVVGNRKIGRHILFQGGVAGNQSVAAAFESLLGKPVTVPEHHNVTGAMGAALAARASGPSKSRFVGFDLKDRPYEMKTFECARCPNVCRINRIYIDGELRSQYGGLCGRYDRSEQTKTVAGPDLFKEREERLLADFTAPASGIGTDTVGIPRVLSFYDYFPFWNAYFRTLGHPIVLSESTNKGLVEKGLRWTPSETCFPIKAVYGHVVDLIRKGVDQVILPCEIDHQRPEGESVRSYNCPYVQSIPYMVKATLGSQVKVRGPIMRWGEGRRSIERELRRLAQIWGYTSAESDRAASAGWEAYRSFVGWQKERGKEVLRALGPGDKAIVLLGKGHNLFDPGLNLHLAGKLRRQGWPAIPFDFLDLTRVTLPAHYDNVVWKNTRDLLKALTLTAEDERLFPVLVTNFGCGPDSFLIKYLESEIGDKPYLILEVDDHTGDAGMITRIEAFLDTLGSPIRTREDLSEKGINLIFRTFGRKTHGWAPSPSTMRRLGNRTLYFPYVSRSYCRMVEAAFEAVGLSAEVLPPPDDETEHLGRAFTSGRECHPYIVTCGEFIKLARRPDFDPDRSAVLMQNYDGACRFSQYGIGHADLFRRLGLSQVPVVAPITSSRWDEFSALFGLEFTRLLWQGWIAAEALERVRLHVRPYEKHSGDTERAFSRGIAALAGAMTRRAKGTHVWDGQLLSALRQSVDALTAVPVDRSQVRPRIGIVGEFYTVLNRWANQDLAKTIEALGGEVALHGLTVPNFYALFSGHYYARDRLRQGRPAAAGYYWLRNHWMMRWVKQVEESLPEALRSLGTLAAGTIVRESDPFIYHDIDPVLATFTARVRQFAALGISGICNLYVLNCMLGNITVPIFKKALAEYPGLPVLHAVYDGQEGTNMLTRIEAFMHQAIRYRKQF